MIRQSTKFLNNTQEFLKEMVTNLNYDTCHAIADYDASVLKIEKDWKERILLRNVVKMGDCLNVA